MGVVKGQKNIFTAPLMYSQATCCDSTACSTFLDPLEGVRRQLFLQYTCLICLTWKWTCPPQPQGLFAWEGNLAWWGLFVAWPTCIKPVLPSPCFGTSGTGSTFSPGPKKLLVKIVPFCLCLFWQWRCLWKGSFFFCLFQLLADHSTTAKTHNALHAVNRKTKKDFPLFLVLPPQPKPTMPWMLFLDWRRTLKKTSCSWPHILLGTGICITFLAISFLALWSFMSTSLGPGQQVLVVAVLVLEVLLGNANVSSAMPGTELGLFWLSPWCSFSTFCPLFVSFPFFSFLFFLSFLPALSFLSFPSFLSWHPSWHSAWHTAWHTAFT